MVSNLTSQLKEADALDRLGEVLEEVPRTRKELGYPPLVTPTSQIVGSQAVSNVLFGRYKMISSQVKDYAYGLYGRPPADPDPQVVKLALEGYERGQTPISIRPGDMIEPELEQAAEDVKDISTDMDDILTYALYPTTGLRFLRIKHGLEPVPDEMKPATNVGPVQAKAPAPKGPGARKSPRTRAFDVYVEGEKYRVEVDPLDASSRSQDGAVVVERPPSGSDTPSKDAIQPQTLSVGPHDTTILAPMPGLVLRYAAEVGQHVEAGDTLVVLEAMKMENSLPSPTSGNVKALPFEIGSAVAKGDMLAIIGD